MSFLRIKKAVPLKGYRLRLTLTDGSIVERDVEGLLAGPVFQAIRQNPVLFRQARAVSAHHRLRIGLPAHVAHRVDDEGQTLLPIAVGSVVPYSSVIHAGLS